MAAGIKRKQATDASKPSNGVEVKKAKVEGSKSFTKREFVEPAKKPSKRNEASELEELVESDTCEGEHGFYGFAAKENSENDTSVSEDSDLSESEKEVKDQKRDVNKAKVEKKTKTSGAKPTSLEGLNLSTSKEAHAKQKALSKERKAAKPNADEIARSKKLWERLRLKSHVGLEERKKLVVELFDIVTGRVKDFVFKHDSVRVIQCALKYSNMEQRKMIATELKGEFRALAESRYAKFLIAKLLEKGDADIHEIIISEFYGHVRRLINHPEASWILDDTYRSMASPEQKAILLREWYGPEFSIFKTKTEGSVSSNLSKILEQSPEKRQPILNHLQGMINQLVQKKLTGFTMLHDAMLQYFLACKPGSSEASEFLEHLKPEAKEGEEQDSDLLKNLAFTKSGSRLVCLAIAHGSAKDRKLLLRAYKDTMELLALDANAHHVLLAALSIIDDTRLSSKSIFGELLPSDASAVTLHEKTISLVNNLEARTVLLYPFAASAKWLYPTNSPTLSLLAELHAIRATTSKKDPTIRLQELAKAISAPLLSTIAVGPSDFANSSFGCQFLTEVLLSAEGDKASALEAVADLAEGDPSGEAVHIAKSPAGCRLLKALVQGGRFDATTKKVVSVEPKLGFADMLWKRVSGWVKEWATGNGSFVIVGLIEADGFDAKDEVVAALRKMKDSLVVAAGDGAIKDEGEKKGKKRKGGMDDEKNKESKGNAGARILLQKLE
ncbi:ARM repeat-containing protein [Lepidopterella palustris CBS 459.81]|uniref:ARM repeat-containing protein n=1 Tax=Lepidopterella palustris CBS 459.81 TaxID=1314670 RepID=A0A8E2EBD0_9PEZI|nr:ARM repeat-containing protein [Lepidopterella palustris CBS 459.81]